MKKYSSINLAPSARILTIVLSVFLSSNAFALTWDFDDWTVNFDNSIAYSMGFRAQSQNSKILNHPVFYSGDEKFPDRGDIVTNRISDLMEFQAVYKGDAGIRVSGSGWKDFAYDDDEEVPHFYCSPRQRKERPRLRSWDERC